MSKIGNIVTYKGKEYRVVKSEIKQTCTGCAIKGNAACQPLCGIGILKEINVEKEQPQVCPTCFGEGETPEHCLGDCNDGPYTICGGSDEDGMRCEYHTIYTICKDCNGTGTRQNTAEDKKEVKMHRLSAKKTRKNKILKSIKIER